MSDKQKKRYYWLKLKEDFFEEDTIAWLEEQPNGKEYCLIYLKLCLKSLKTSGMLVRNVGNIMIPYDAEALAKITNSSSDSIKVAMNLFEKIGLIQMLNDGEIYLNQLDELVGSETEFAKQKRLQRATKSKLMSGQLVDNVQIKSIDENKETGNTNVFGTGGQCPENVAQSIELELEKELELEEKKVMSNKDIYDYYEKNGFGAITHKTITDFDYWVQDLIKIGANEEDAILMIIHALGIAIDNNVRKYAYVNSILTDWERRKFLSVEQVQAEDKKFKPNNNFRKNTKKEKIPEYINQPTNESVDESPNPDVDQKLKEYLAKKE